MFLHLLAFAAILVSAAVAQLANLPQCSLQCMLTALGSDGCTELTDFKCHCEKSQTLWASVQPCISEACASDEQGQVVAGLENTCASAGVPVAIGNGTVILEPPQSTEIGSVSSAASEVSTTETSAASAVGSTASPGRDTSTVSEQRSTSVQTKTSSKSTQSSPLTTTEPPASNNKNACGNSKSNMGAIAGGVVGGLAVLCVAVVAIFYIRRRHPRSTQKSSEAPAKDHDDVVELVQKRSS